MEATTTEVMEATEARRRVDRIRAGLENVYDDVIALHRGQGWLVLGYPTWAELCTAEFPLRPALQANQRQEFIKPMTEAGMPQTAIAEVLDVSRDTVQRDQKRLAEIGTLNRPEKVESHDGRLRPSSIPRDLPKPPAPELTEEDQRAIERHQADIRRWTRTAEAIVTLWSISGPWMEGFDDANLNDPIFTDTWTPDFLAHARDNLEQLIEWSKNR